MGLRTYLAAASLLVLPCGAISANAFTSLHPEEAYPDPTEQASQGAFTGFISRVQQKLLELGFAAGPVNGDFGSKTQAALTQFQLSRAIPASGQLDEETLAELGVQRDSADTVQSAASGATATTEPAAAQVPSAEKSGN